MSVCVCSSVCSCLITKYDGSKILYLIEVRKINNIMFIFVRILFFLPSIAIFFFAALLICP